MIDRRSVLGAAAFALAGCAITSERTFDNDYNESFESFAMSPDGEILLVIGEKFDYVFTPQPSLVRALRSSSFRPQLTASFHHFRLDSPTKLSGIWGLSLSTKKARPEEERLLKELGFRVSMGTDWTLDGFIEGTRYLKNQATKLSQLENTNKPYSLTIYGGPAREAAGKIEPIPASRGGDGGLFFLGILLYPFILSGAVWR